MTVQQLIQRLDQKVQQLYQAHLSKREEKIFAKFDRTLFSENGQNVSFYLKEINQTLDRIKTLESNDSNHYNFLAERLLAQCSVLSEALVRKNTHLTESQTTTKQTIQKSQHSIHKLPPRERLEKYYEAREQLNNLYRQHKDLAQAEKNNDEKIRYAQLAEVYKKRQQKCQDAIDLLEEYLVFKEEVENRENTQNK
ncbi:primosomal replication protein [Haemophilus influenzae]|uniref:Primosomal replication protein priB and priC n=2 Tax=Haemophilus influenzae TaxID=727 RepID=A0A1Q5Y411_HAEIF|nr:primosomal replication protein PriC [Haemophilus influenzae]ABQ99844.1 predicted primosomal replication protein N [Haemophilus influenzae PittGG]EEW78288.1 primosomal replication protein N [Haemophilus influenzae NT127]MCK8789185.1 primosomal replication protein [Haemophilus influenzae]MCK8794574.1 primosomal replication protein [Haemophilus influenzae]MCK8829587.1 primosomal replication protein [Haemophilus influenzae]